jgi:3-hydroxyacyl-CoA dehydrogenase
VEKTLKIRRAAVLGAGVMGAQIAAHLAAAGVRTYLLDLASNEPPTDKNTAKAVGKNFRSTRAILAIENLKVLKPAPLMSESVLANIIPGNFDDDMSVLADCDWILEAVVERLDIKKSIHKRIAEFARPNVPVTTNTSGISLAKIVGELDETYATRFFGTHFFNPARYMKLLEIIPHDTCDKKLMHDLTDWLEARLGKGIVWARDTVNFVANRVGVLATQSTVKHMGELGLNIETVDALTGPLIGRAKSATFRTVDVIGIDTYLAVARNTYDVAPQDPYRELFLSPAWIQELTQKGHLGQKSGGIGCYKKDKDKNGRTVILSYRPETKSYEPEAITSFPWMAEAEKERDTIKRLKFILKQQGDGAEFIWRVIRDVMSYSAILTEEIAGGIPQPIDDALRWGFNWEWGPFELWQALGYEEILSRMQKDKTPLPAWTKKGTAFYKPEPNSLAWHMNGGAKEQFNAALGKFTEIPKPAHVYTLPQFENREDKRVVLSNKSASLVDIGDGVACLTFHSKMNSIDADIMELSQKTVAKVMSSFDALVIGNDGGNFSAGANLKMILGAIAEKKWSDIDHILRQFQGALQLIKFAPFPSVSCPYGLTLGGGCEVSLHTTERVLAGETYAGLVEMGVGLIPAGGGTKELALRAYDHMKTAERGDPMPFLQHAFMLIGMAKVSTSGMEAVEMGLYPRYTTTVSLSREHLIAKAKDRALLSLKQGYAAPSPRTALKVVGDPGIQTFRLMLYNMVEGRQISSYDAFIGEKIATVLCGGEVDGGSIVTEQYLLDLERRVFLELCQRQKTAERIEAMLKTGKALRN